ncbi:hypothetical protein GPZ80_30755 [Actinokineospora sp. HBU206404]|uniref:WXG100 family type VII secretion target n=1 Tax=Actinokineospora xionganensis TaxID=2684470 RepID=A0ABR7LGN3_9PSEU|nr:hypothetical protein [Actinokineospora xionganensis]
MDATEFLVLSPPRIWDAFHGFAGAGGENYLTDIAEIVDLLKDSIGDWEGAAAQAFVAHVSNIESFVRFQNKNVEDMLLGYAATYKHAIQIRESYKALVEGWIGVSRKYREDSDERERAVRIKVAVGALAAMAAVGSGGTLLAVGLGAASAMAGAAAEEFTADLGGDSGDEVWKLYEKAYQKLVEANRDGMDEIRRLIAQADDRIAREGAPLSGPNSTKTDVDSPDFSYGAFYHNDIGDEFSRQVEAERKKLAAERNPSGFRQDGTIATVLSGFEPRGPVADV